MGVLREYGPVGLVPLAWIFAIGAHLGIIGARPVLIGHAVMAVLLAAFAVLSYREMLADRALRAWLAVIVAGFVVTVVGAYGVVDGDPTLVRVPVFGWMALPAAGLLYTGRAYPDGEGRVYTAGGVLSTAGAAAFLAATLSGVGPITASLALAGVGQTAGIVAAAAEPRPGG